MSNVESVRVGGTSYTAEDVERMLAELEQLRLICRLAKGLNTPMLERLRRCAADTSSNWELQTRVYPPETLGLVALIDACAAPKDPRGEG